MPKEQMEELRDAHLELALILEEMIDIDNRVDNEEEVTEEELLLIMGRYTKVGMTLAKLSV